VYWKCWEYLEVAVDWLGKEGGFDAMGIVVYDYVTDEIVGVE
jgi:hypothetical protein